MQSLGLDPSAYPVGGVAVKKVLCTDRACGQVSALVGLELGQAHAAIALHAVSCISAQPFPHTADITEGAVVDVSPRLVVKKLTDVAEVAGHARAAGMAVSCSQTRVPSASRHGSGYT